MDAAKYSILNCASIDFEYLHTNSTTHEFLFGAIAELVDNSRDAKADTLHIDYGGGQLSFLDDGCGMDKKEVQSVISFGYSAKRMDPEMVGQYGNGLKSAAMRIGKDMLMFTKKEGLLTCMLISRSFLEDNNLKKVIVPTPSFLEDGTAYYETMDEMEKHTLETKVICEYSPFTSSEELLTQFKRIRGESGTLVICYNLRRIDGGKFEMDFETDPFDVRLTGHIPHREEERNSLRAYLAVLYANPRMRVFLRGEKVDTKRILGTLYKPRMYKYQARNLKGCAEKELQECQKKVVELNDTVARCKSEVADFEVRHPNFMSDATLRIHYRTLVKAVDVAGEMLSTSEKRLKKLARAKSNPSPLLFYFGLNIQHRNRYGCMLYNNGRLIKMYEKVNNQKEKNDRMLKYLGVVAVVDVPCSVLAPAHSKQSFENPREYANLLKAVNDYMEQYWNDTAIAATPGGVANFWRLFGYESMEWNAEPSNETEFLRKRYSSVGYSLQCHSCLKWRHLQFQQSYLTEGFPKDWNCSMNPNSLFRSCSKLEELPKIPEGRLMKLPDKPPMLTTEKEKEPTSARSHMKTQRTPTARKRLPTPPPLRSSQRKLRAPLTRSRSPSESESSEDTEPVAAPKTSIQKKPLKKSTVGVGVRRANEARSPASTVSTTSNKMLTSIRRAPVMTSQRKGKKCRSQIYNFHNSDEDNSSEEEQPPVKRKSLAKAMASISNGTAKKQTVPVKEVRKSVESVELVSVEKSSGKGFIHLSRRKREEKVPEARETKSVLLRWSAKKAEAAQSSTANGSAQGEQEAHKASSSIVEEFHENRSEKQHASSSTVEEVCESRSIKPEANKRTVEVVHEAVVVDQKKDLLIRRLNEVLEFFRESSFPKIHFADADEALAFDLRAYFAAYHRGIEALIDEQVTQKVRKYLECAVKVMKWADPEVADEINDENVLEKMDEFTKLI